MVLGCRRALLVLAAIGAGLIGTPDGSGFAQDFPSRTVKIIVPFPAGGSLDVVARLVAEKLSEVWSQPVVVENRPGANGIVAADGFIKSPPDGYTILFATGPVFTTNKLLFKHLPYDPECDSLKMADTSRQGDRILERSGNQSAARCQPTMVCLDLRLAWSSA